MVPSLVRLRSGTKTAATAVGVVAGFLIAGLLVPYVVGTPSSSRRVATDAPAETASGAAGPDAGAGGTTTTVSLGTTAAAAGAPASGGAVAASGASATAAHD